MAGLLRSYGRPERIYRGEARIPKVYRGDRLVWQERIDAPVLTLTLVGRTTVTYACAEVDGATEYRFRYQVSGATTYTTTAWGSLRTGSFVGLFSTTYAVEVQCRNSVVESDWETGTLTTQARPVAPPPPPVAPPIPSLTVRVSDRTVSGSIGLVPGATYSWRYRSGTSGAWMTSAFSQTRTFSFPGSYDTSYQVEVASRRGGLTSQYGSRQTASIGAAPPTTGIGAPPNLSLVTSDRVDGGMVLSWGAVSTATLYEVSIQAFGETSYSPYPLPVPGDRIHLLDGDPGRRYRVRVRAGRPRTTGTGTEWGPYAVSDYARAALLAPDAPTGIVRDTPTPSTVDGRFGWILETATVDIAATGYEAYYQARGSDTWTSAAVRSDGSASLLLDPGRQYRVQILAVRTAFGLTVRSDSFFSFLSRAHLRPPGRPASVTGTARAGVDGGIAWSWGAGANATGYEYEWRPIERATWSPRQTTSATSANRVHPGGRQMRLRVRSVRTAFGRTVRSEWRESATVRATLLAPGRPSTVTGTARRGVDGGISWVWGAGSNATGYEYQVRPIDRTPITWNPVRSLTSTSVNITHQPARQMRMRVRATRTAFGLTVRSEWRESATVRARLLAPAVPTLAGRQRAGVDGGLFISVGSAARATGYEADYQLVGTSTWTAITLAGPVGRSANLTLLPGRQYRVRVRASRTAFGYTELSLYWTNTYRTTLLAPPIPTDVTVVPWSTVFPGSMAVRFTSSPRATGYEAGYQLEGTTAWVRFHSATDSTRTGGTNLGQAVARRGLVIGSRYRFRIRSVRTVDGRTLRSGWHTTGLVLVPR